MPANVIPIPKRFERGEGTVILDPSWGLNNLGADKRVIEHYSIKLSLAPRKKNQNITLRRTNMSNGEESYDLEIKPNSIIVSAQTERGFLFALQTLGSLKSGDNLPACMVNDWPSLPMRGILLDLSVLREIDAEGVISVLSAASRYKLNRVILDYGDRFPYAEMEDEQVAGKFTKDEIERISRTGLELALDLAPVVRTLKGLGFVLRQRRYAELREPPGPDGRNDQVCPSNPASLKLVTAMGEQILKAHRARMVVLGGNDSQQLGNCPECRKLADEKGPGWLFADYVNRVSNSLLRRSRRPIVFDDIISRWPDALETLDKRTYILYRDYWTTKPSTPLLAARFARTNQADIVYDARWRDEWAGDLGDLDDRILKAFADVHGEPKRLEETLGREFLNKFRNYLGANYPKYITGFPYINYYKDQGFQVIGMPALLADVKQDLRHDLPHFERFFHNIKAFARRVKDEGELGVVSAAVNDWPHETMLHGIVATAQFAWR